MLKAFLSYLYWVVASFFIINGTLLFVVPKGVMIIFGLSYEESLLVGVVLSIILGVFMKRFNDEISNES